MNVPPDYRGRVAIKPGLIIEVLLALVIGAVGFFDSGLAVLIAFARGALIIVRAVTKDEVRWDEPDEEEMLHGRLILVVVGCVWIVVSIILAIILR